MIKPLNNKINKNNNSTINKSCIDLWNIINYNANATIYTNVKTARNHKTRFKIYKYGL